MKKIFLGLALILFTNFGFTTSTDSDPSSCYDFAENQVQQLENLMGFDYDLTYEEEYNYWLWHYDYCMDPNTWWNQGAEDGEGGPIEH